MTETTHITDSAQEAGQQTKEFEIQWGVKWTNFTVTVEASSVKEAFEKAVNTPVNEMEVTAGHRGISSLEDLLYIAQKHRVQIHDEAGNEYEGPNPFTGWGDQI